MYSLRHLTYTVTTKKTKGLLLDEHDFIPRKLKPKIKQKNIAIERIYGNNSQGNIKVYLKLNDKRLTYNSADVYPVITDPSQDSV